MAGNVQNILHVLTNFTFTTRPSAGNYCPHHMGREVLSQRLNNQFETTQLLKKPQVQAVSSTAHGLGHPPILLNPHSSAEWLLNEYMLSESMLSECLNESKRNSLQDSRSHSAVFLRSRFSRPLPFLSGPYGLLGQQVNSWPMEGAFPSGLQGPLAAFGEAASPIIPSPAHSDLCLFFFN